MKFDWLDEPGKYSAISKALHWGMAAIFAWQFTGMMLLATLGETPLSIFFIGSHGALGTLLFLLVALRLVWRAYNAHCRPGYEASLSGVLAKIGHAAIYGLIIVVPLLALLRSYGSGREFMPFGIPLWGASEEKIVWLIEPADLAHGLLAWALLALIVGHIGMAIWHRVIKRDQVWQRMA
ncbi:cytochrome b/b6 domain-containing protein [Escherichia coli]